jgi:hypothetical protein
MQKHTSRIFRICLSVLYAIALIAAQVAPAAAKPHTASASMNVSFVGGGTIHLVFSSWSEAKNLTLTILGGEANNGDLVIPYNTTHYRLTGFSPNSVVYFINKEDGVTLATANTSSFHGTMMYSEVFDSVTLTAQGDEPNGDVIVPELTSLSIINSTVRGSLAVSTQGNASLHIDQTSVENNAAFSNQGSKTGSGIKVENSTFGGFVSLAGGVLFDKNEVRSGIFFNQPSGATVQNNLLEGPIYYDCYALDPSTCDWNAGPFPTILGNSFLGNEAFRVSLAVSIPVQHVGSNYYGDPNAVNNSVTSPYVHRVFLKEREALNISNGHIVMDAIASYGDTIKKLKPGFESVHLNSYLIGQNSIDHKNTSWTGMMERKTLLSIDLGTSYATLSGVRVIVHFNGKDYVKSNINLRHTITDCNDRDSGKCTIDFELDPVPYADISSVSVPISAEVDLSDVPGSTYTTLIPIITDTVGFYSPPARPLRIDVVPVDTSVFCSGKADPSGVINELKAYLPAMFSVRKQDVDVRLRSRYTYNCVNPLAALSPALIAGGAMAEVAAIDKLDNGASADLIVVVMPYNSMKSLITTDVEGMSLHWMNGVVLVNPAARNAELHEIGHWAGLALSPEQYEQYKPNGLPLRDTTVYDPDGKNAEYMAAQIQHFTSPGYYGWREDKIYDIMSNQTSVWPLYDSAGAIQTAIYNKVGYKGASSLVPASIPAASGSLVQPSGTTRTAYFYGTTYFNTAGSGENNYFIRPDSLHMIDLTGMGVDPGDSPEKSDSIYTRRTYNLLGFDASGALIYHAPFYTYLDNNYGITHNIARGFIYHTMQIPDNVKRVMMTDAPENGNQVYLDVSATNTVNSQFTSPAAGSTLAGASVTLTWTNPSAHLLHLLTYSADNGLTWNSLGLLPFEGSSVEILTAALPATGQLAFRLITTDGFSHAEDQVSNLTLNNRLPEVTILSPQAGTQVAPGTEISLTARVTDLEDGPIYTGTWTSNIDGDLGQGANLEHVTLSSGTHALTFTTQDSAGVSVQSQVTITVGAVSQVDLQLDARAISLSYLHMDPVLPLHALTAGTDYTLTVAMHGAGIDTTPTLDLYVKPSGGAETLLSSQVVTLPAFVDTSMTASFNTAVSGEYTFRAVLTSTTPPDSNAANNQATLEISGLPKTYSSIFTVFDQRFITITSPGSRPPMKWAR